MLAATLSDLLSPQRLTEVVDIGANPVDGEPPYQEMLWNGLCRVTGFEPQEDALRVLLEGKGPNETYLPYAIGDGNAATLRICAASGMTSLLEPRAATLAMLDRFAEWGTVLARQPLQTRRLDDVAEIDTLDYLKIDVQGSELAVFRGGAGKLARAVAIQTEVSFVNLYENQPSIGEVDIELRRQGFLPHCITQLKLWPLLPWRVPGDARPESNQLLEADLVYVRDISRPELLDDEQLKHLALVAHHCYRSFDLALRCVALLEQRGALAADAQGQYLQSLRESQSPQDR